MNTSFNCIKEFHIKNEFVFYVVMKKCGNAHLDYFMIELMNKLDWLTNNIVLMWINYTLLVYQVIVFFIVLQFLIKNKIIFYNEFYLLLILCYHCFFLTFLLHKRYYYFYFLYKILLTYDHIWFRKTVGYWSKLNLDFHEYDPLQTVDLNLVYI